MTTTKTPIDLKVGDVIVPIDGSRHTVLTIDRYELEGAWLTFTTDTGLTITKNRFTAFNDLYVVDEA